MSDSRVFTYRLDRGNVISYVSPEWLAFATENAAPELVTPGVVGKSIWRFITGIETHHLYTLILKRVRAARVTIGFAYRCDSPQLRRYLELVVQPQSDDAVEFASRIVREEPRAPVPLLASAVARTEQFVKMCSWCKRIATPDWLEVEAALPRLGIFEHDVLPQITHGICADCERQIVLATE